MIHKDYIMRMIQQLSTVLMKILFNKETQNYDQAQAEIDEAYGELLGWDPILARGSSAEEILFKLQTPSGLDTERAMVVAELLREEAEIRELQFGLDSEVLDLYARALVLYVAAMQTEPHFRQPSWRKKIDRMIPRLESSPLSVDTLISLFHYYKLFGKLNKAADVLQNILKTNDARGQKLAAEFQKHQSSNQDP